METSADAADEASSSRVAPPPRAALPSGTVLHPRGRLTPPLPTDAPRWKRVRRGALRLGQGLVLHDAFQAAPAMAFHFFLSLLPLLVFLGYVVASIARRKGVETMLWPLLDNLPSAAAEVVKAEVIRLARASTLGRLAAVGFLWLASGGTHGLIHALETVVGAPRRPWWKKRALALAWVLAALVATSAASWGMIQWDAVVHAAPAAAAHEPATASSGPAAPPEGSPERADPTPAKSPTVRRHHHHSVRWRVKLLRSEGERALVLLASLALVTLGLAAFYRFSVSHSKRIKRRVLPGALLAVGLWVVISWVFGLYVSTLAEYAVFYGSLAAVAVLLVWLWLISLAILVGAELNSQLEGLRD